MGSMPSFFVVGAMKAGTTSICELLSAHPNVFIPFEKEPNYFAWIGEHNCRHLVLPGPQGSRLSASGWHQYTCQDAYMGLFSKATEGDRIAGEGSTIYLAHTPAAQEIHDFNPTSKIVVSLRDPVHRAYSAYQFQRSFGAEHSASLIESLEEERRGLREDLLYGWRYLHCSTYSAQLENYQRLFGSDNVHVLLFESFVEDPIEEIRRVFAFLGIDRSVRPELDAPANATYLPSRIPAYLKHVLFSNQPKSLAAAKHLLPISMRRSVKNLVLDVLNVGAQRPPEIDSEEYAAAWQYFARDVEKLRSLVDVDLQNWGQKLCE